MSSSENKKEVLVALSGGVDSAASVLILQEKGFLVRGVYFEMFDCDGSDDAKNIARQLGIELEIVDLREEFRQTVLENFFEEYRAGRTPNPCTLCNQRIKFEFLLQLADKLGIRLVSTGHYARISEIDGNFFVTKAKDLKKDQSYFLYRLKSIQLGRVLFPLGSLTKEEVKQIASSSGLKIPKKESQDICFMNDDNSLKNFLSSELKVESGDIVTEKNEVIGKHDGVAFYTIGQRRGLNVNGGPYYVFQKDVEKNIIFVTKNKEHESLRLKEIPFGDLSWSNFAPKNDVSYSIKTRYLTRESDAKVVCKKGGSFAITKEPQWAVASGQSLVVYDGELVLGGGIIR